MQSNATIGIDLGGSRIKSVCIDAAGTVLQESYHPTDDGDDSVWKHTVYNAVNSLEIAMKQTIPFMGIAAPGLPNNDHTAIACMPGRLAGLENFDWSGFINKPVFVLNDAVAALLAESRFGAAKNKKHVVLLTLGTGVGGAILIDGKPYLGAFNKAGHIGHMVIDEEGESDVTGMPGSLETCIGNCTIQKRSNGKFNSTFELLHAYKNKDVFAKEIWLKSIKQLALGLSSLTNILSPETIILGGGITAAGNDLFDPLMEFMKAYEWRAGGNKAEIVKAKFGELAGAIGAACFAAECNKNLSANFKEENQ